MVVLLVEDEEVELNMLEHSVDWSALGVDKVYTAGNGRRALQIVKEKKPDIVITDIEMPVMDGITLARRIREMGLGIKIIYLTGYDDFTYIKVAFKIDAVDYILKPVVPAVLKEVISRSAALIEKEREAEQSFEISKQKLIELLVLEGEVRVPAGIMKDLSEPFTLLQVYGGMDKDTCGRICRQLPEISYGVWECDRITFLAAAPRNLRKLSAAILAEGRNSHPDVLNLVYIRDPLDKSELHTGYLAACGYRKYLYYEADGAILEGKLDEAEDKGVGTDSLKSVQEVLEAAVSRYRDALPQAGEGLIKEITAGLFSRMKRERWEVSDAVKLLSGLVWELDLLFVRGNDRIGQFLSLNAEKAIDRIHGSCHALGAERVLTDYLMQILSYFQMQKQGKGSFVVMKVKEYIEANYQGQISMEALGEALQLSPNYIRGIFKEQTGQTILEYITNYRFSMACLLLKDKNLKIREVSSRVGYENVSYFCSVFTRRYGVSPSEYRNSF